jgi:hypothetical protein
MPLLTPLSDRGPDHLRRFHTQKPKASVSQTAKITSQIIGSWVRK